MPPPLTTTLFPYTTLFRSVRSSASCTRSRRRATGGLNHVGSAANRHRRRSTHAGESSVGDRKSTRLNSSHLVISYAVFCLNKTKMAGRGKSPYVGEGKSIT